MSQETKQDAKDSRSKLEEQAQTLLQNSAEYLDGRTRSRLTQARQAALEAVQPPQRGAVNWVLPASGVAAAAVLAVIVATNVGQQTGEQSSAQVVLAPDALEIVTAEDSLEFYRDVEFYAWLDTVLDDEPSEASGA